ncbi:hypothetical protein GCM10009624_24680 [Gordonia sinesedis]
MSRRQHHSAAARTVGCTCALSGDAARRQRPRAAGKVVDATFGVRSFRPPDLGVAAESPPSTDLRVAVDTLNTMSSDPPSVEQAPARHRFWWLRWVLIVVVVVVLAVEAVLIWPKLAQTWSRIGDLDWVWLLACVIAALLSMDSFAQVQRALLRSAGVRVTQWQSLSVILAANSLSQTMPGGQVLAPAFTYRQTRRWGATPVVASWQVVMSGLLAGVGLAALGFGGAVLAGIKTSPFSLIFWLLGFVAIAAVLQYLTTHPESLQSTGVRMLSWVNQLRNKPTGHGVAKLRETLEQLRAVHLTRRDASIAFGWSLFNWVADVACLMFACWAVGAHPSIAGLMVAYAAGKAVGTAVPLLPGGIGVVDAVLVPALISAGMPAADALTAVLVYRVISYVLIAALGWVVIMVMFRSGIRDGETMDEEIEHDLSRSGADSADADATDAGSESSESSESSGSDSSGASGAGSVASDTGSESSGPGASGAGSVASDSTALPDVPDRADVPDRSDVPDRADDMPSKRASTNRVESIGAETNHASPDRTGTDRAKTPREIGPGEPPEDA